MVMAMFLSPYPAQGQQKAAGFVVYTHASTPSIITFYIYSTPSVLIISHFMNLGGLKFLKFDQIYIAK